MNLWYDIVTSFAWHLPIHMSSAMCLSPHTETVERIIVLLRFGWLKQWLNAAIPIIMHNSYTLPSFLLSLVLPIYLLYSVPYQYTCVLNISAIPPTQTLWLGRSECGGFIHLEVCRSVRSSFALCINIPRWFRWATARERKRWANFQ